MHILLLHKARTSVNRSWEAMVIEVQLARHNSNWRSLSNGIKKGRLNGHW
jgi:hypothetical protein